MHIQGGIFMEYTKLGNSDLKTARRILVTLVMS